MIWNEAQPLPRNPLNDDWKPVSGSLLWPEKRMPGGFSSATEVECCQMTNMSHLQKINCCHDMSISQIARSNTFVKVCICVHACAGVRKMTCTRSNKEHSEPHGTTLALNYIMPFNSSTPKIDGYCNSSVLATAKEGRRKKKKKEPQQASVKCETLGSGWDQACKSTLTTGNSWTQHVSQSHGSTVHTSYSQHCHRERRRKRKSHFKHSPASEERERPHRPPYKKNNKSDTIPSGWLFTLFTNDTEEKSLCFSLITAQYDERKTKKEEMGTFIQPPETGIFKTLLYGSWWTKQIITRLYKSENNQDWENQTYGVPSPPWQHFSPFKGLFMNNKSKYKLAHVISSMDTLHYNH